MVRLPKINATLFNLYIQWTYSKKIDLDMVDADDDCGRCDTPGHNERCQSLRILDLLIDVYLTGKFLGDIALGNHTADAVLEHFSCANGGYFTEAQIDKIWKYTAATSALRKCVLYSIIIGAQVLRDVERWNSQFLLDLCNLQLESWPKHDRTRLHLLDSAEVFLPRSQRRPGLPALECSRCPGWHCNHLWETGGVEVVAACANLQTVRESQTLSRLCNSKRVHRRD